MRQLLLLTSLLVSTMVSAEEIDLDEVIHVLKYVETENNPEAKGDWVDGIAMSYGVLQVKQIAIDDVNRRYGTSYEHEDMFDEVCAEEVFKLYVTMWAEHLQKKELRAATELDIVRIWNGGPRGYRKKATLHYMNKYTTRKKKMIREEELSR